MPKTTEEEKPARPWTTRIKDPEDGVALFGGAIVNGTKLRKDCLNNCPAEALRKLVRIGMPVIELPNSQRPWFDPQVCLDWYRQHQKIKNQERSERQPRPARRRIRAR